MAVGKTTPFKGSKFFIQTGEDAGKVITGITNAQPPVVSIANHGYTAGTPITIKDVNAEVDGAYIVANPDTGTFELQGADFTAVDTIVVTAESKAYSLTFTSACEVTSINKTGGTIDQTEVSSICSERKEYESGLADAGTLQINFNYAPATAVQQKLEEYELSAEKFWQKLVLPRQQGTLLLYGAIQTGMNIDGAVNGVFTSSVTIQLSGNYYRIPAA